MSQNLILFRAAAPERSDAAIYTGPEDVVGDPNLTTADKKAILASSVSDARAVEDEPTLRRLDSGAVVEVEAVLEALRGLDPSGGVVVRLPTRVARRKDLDDDDPPPTPARAGIPPCPIHVDAYGGLRRLASGAI
jgi:hypothetical protein